ncbi:MAG: hypothetical protein RL324_297 [Verrucomicrobiota bacterium]
MSSSKKKPSARKKPDAPRASLLGVGLDNTDGHKRVTRGERFVIAGGSAETHERMTETVVKTFEELKQRRKDLNEVEPTELAEIIGKSTPR